MTAPDWVQPVLTGAFLVLAYRVVRTSGAGLRAAVAFMIVLNVGLLWLMWDEGPPWAVPAVIAVSLAAAVVNTVAAARTALERVERVDTARFRELVEHVTSSDGPQVLGVCVTYTGALVLTAFGSDARPEGRQFHLPPGSDCRSAWWRIRYGGSSGSWTRCWASTAGTCGRAAAATSSSDGRPPRSRGRAGSATGRTTGCPAGGPPARSTTRCSARRSRHLLGLRGAP
ncbi:hypothetical protein [Streptomyces sp. NPDC048357]|uniref:hypothetical protein n=1 Tax=Streptomyces sp. NPDC048357 TaxID=3154719 RepID=UPI0034362976